MKKFFNQILASISSLEYYKSILYRPFWEVFRFYALFLLVVSLILSLNYWLTTLPYLERIATETLSDISTHFPSDLHIEWNGQKLQTSADPLVVPYPNAVPLRIQEVSEYLVTVTNQEEVVPEVDTLFLISPSRVHVVNNRTLSEGIPLADFLGSEAVVLNTDTWPLISQQLKEQAAIVFKGVGYLYPFASFIYLLFSRMYILLVETFIIYILIKIQRLPLSYAQLFQLSMAIFVPAEIIQLVTNLAQLEVPISMLTLSYWILFVVVFFSLQKKPTVQN